MEVTEHSIIITDPEIISYYKENPNINMVTMNHIFINILKNLSSNLTNTVNHTINEKILLLVTQMNTNLSSLKTDILFKLYDSKKEYIEEVKNMFSNNALSIHEKVYSLLDKNNDILLSKTTMVIQEWIPKSNQANYIQIENCIKNCCSAISQDTTRLLENTRQEKSPLPLIMENIHSHLDKMVLAIQQPIFQYIQTSEERTNQGIQQMREKFISQQGVQENLTNEMKDHLNKYKNNSSYKGNVAERDLYDILIHILPTDEIIKVATESKTCDFRVHRKDPTKPSILFESKNYQNAVNTQEVTKFERDVQSQKIHGIFISQQSPITFKNKFQIDIINHFIHVYIPNAQYDVDKIKIAIDIIDNLALKLDAISYNKDELTISKEDLEDLIQEYHTFAYNKLQMLDTIRSVTKQLTDKLEEIQLPKMKKYLTKMGSIENDNEFKCHFCNQFTGKSKMSLGAHVRKCKLNPKCNSTDTQHENLEEDSENMEDTVLSNNIVIAPVEQVLKTPKSNRKEKV